MKLAYHPRVRVSCPRLQALVDQGYRFESDKMVFLTVDEPLQKLFLNGRICACDSAVTAKLRPQGLIVNFIRDEFKGTPPLSFQQLLGLVDYDFVSRIKIARNFIFKMHPKSNLVVETPSGKARFTRVPRPLDERLLGAVLDDILSKVTFSFHKSEVQVWGKTREECRRARAAAVEALTLANVTVRKTDWQIDTKVRFFDMCIDLVDKEKTRERLLEAGAKYDLDEKYQRILRERNGRAVQPLREPQETQHTDQAQLSVEAQRPNESQLEEVQSPLANNSQESPPPNESQLPEEPFEEAQLREESQLPVEIRLPEESQLPVEIRLCEEAQVPEEPYAELQANSGLGEPDLFEDTPVHFSPVDMQPAQQEEPQQPIQEDCFQPFPIECNRDCFYPVSTHPMAGKEDYFEPLSPLGGKEDCCQPLPDPLHGKEDCFQPLSALEVKEDCFQQPSPLEVKEDCFQPLSALEVKEDCFQQPSPLEVKEDCFQPLSALEVKEDCFQQPTPEGKEDCFQQPTLEGKEDCFQPPTLEGKECFQPSIEERQLISDQAESYEPGPVTRSRKRKRGKSRQTKNKLAKIQVQS